MNDHPSLLESSILDFIKNYELAANSRDFSKVSELIHPNANFIFPGGRYVGRETIRNTFEKVWSLENGGDDFNLSDIKTLCADTGSATITFQYHWTIFIDDQPHEITGRGTSVIVNNNTKLQIIHEHLSHISE